MCRCVVAFAGKAKVQLLTHIHFGKEAKIVRKLGLVRMARIWIFTNFEDACTLIAPSVSAGVYSLKSSKCA